MVKKQRRDIDRRVRFFERRLYVCAVVDRHPADQTKVFFGAWVTLEDEVMIRLAAGEKSYVVDAIEYRTITV